MQCASSPPQSVLTTAPPPCFLSHQLRTMSSRSCERSAWLCERASSSLWPGGVFHAASTVVMWPLLSVVIPDDPARPAPPAPPEDSVKEPVVERKAPPLRSSPKRAADLDDLDALERKPSFFFSAGHMEESAASASALRRSK